MATYKVIQDIESEDKLIGPLTLKQTIYFLIAAGFLGIGYLIGQWLGLVITSPIGLFFIVMAWPWNRYQPNDVFILARLNFWFRPKKRLWQQNYDELKIKFETTAPKTAVIPTKPGVKSSQTQDTINQLSHILDSPDNDETIVLEPSMTAKILEKEHDQYIENMAQHFDHLISKNHSHKRLQTLSQFKAGLESSDQPPQPSKQNLSQSQSQSDIIKTIPEHGDLKIATILSLTKSKHKQAINKTT